jgi:D-3-phosphoglycerate dehydrogenase
MGDGAPGDGVPSPPAGRVAGRLGSGPASADADGAPGDGVPSPPAGRAPGRLESGPASVDASLPFQVLVLNQISANGLKRLPAERYTVGKSVARPVAVLVRSADMHTMDIPASVRAIGRAGAGTNNIPVEAMSGRGVPVFNAPGANANAVKELVLAGMLLAARNLAPALRFVATLDPGLPDMDKAVEEGKKAFAGFELQGQTLGIVGLGKVGCLVADAAIKLGMDVLGYDPHITVDAAWSLPAQVRKAGSVADVLKNANFVTLHVPLIDATRDLVNADNVGQMKAGAVLLNFSREGVVNEAAVLASLSASHLAHYVCDFPSAALNRHDRVIALPHLGASTREAEENCAIMVADQLRDYLENGNIANAVNFPHVAMARESAFRVAIANANVPNMLGQISTAMAKAGLNIHNMVNKSRGDMAYTLVDVDSAVDESVLANLRSITGVLSVRYLPDGPT